MLADPERRDRPTFIVTHRLALSEATRGYERFKNKEEDCLEVVLEP